METLKFVMTTDMYPPFHIGGDAVFVKYLAEELASKGHEVHVIHSMDAYNFKKGRSEKKYEKIKNVSLYPISSPLGNFDPYLVYASGNSPFIYRKYKEIVEKVRPDVIHHHNISLLGYRLLKKLGNHQSIYTAHSYWLMCPNQRLFKCDNEVCEERECFTCGLYTKRPTQIWRRGKAFKECVQDIDVLTAPSTYVANKLSQYLGVEVVTLLNFVPEQPDYIVPSGFSNFFLYAGALERHKGILDLINVYKEVCSEIDEQLLIVGAGSLSDEIKEFVNRNRLEDKIILLGRVDNNLLYRLLKDANALLMPSIWPENCPLIALEALSLGTPTIASNKGGLPEIVEKIDADLIYNSAGELYQTLLNFNKNNYSSSMIRQVYDKYYSAKAYLETYFKLINNLL